MKKRLEHYWFAMNVAGVQAGAHSVKAYVALATGHAASADAVPALNITQLGVVFAAAFVIGLTDFLDKNPIPITLDEPPAEQKQNP